jgi:hypothetical protein
LAAEWPRIAILDLDEERQAETLAAIQSAGVQAEAFCVDLADPAAVSNVVVAVGRDSGRSAGSSTTLAFSS